MKPEPDVVKPQPVKEEDIKLENPAMLIHPNQFATFVGVSSDVVRFWIYSGYLPTVKIGKIRLINLLKLRELLSTTQPEFKGFNEEAA